MGLHKVRFQGTPSVCLKRKMMVQAGQEETQQVSQQTFTYTIFHAGCKRKRCGSCKGCNSDDCGTCLYCQDKPKFGGPGKKKQCCEKRKCLEMQNNKVMKLLCKIQLASLIYFHQVILPSPETSSSTLSSRSALPPAATPLTCVVLSSLTIRSTDRASFL